MAKIQFGDIVTDMRGKVGGAVYTANANGAMKRQRVKPSNPRTAAQIAVRNKVSVLSQNWPGLTDAQRLAWNAATPSYPYKDSLGNTKYYTGQQLFMTLNSSLRAANPAAALLTSPPTSGAVTPVTVGVLTATTTAGVLTALSLAYSPTVPAGHNVILYATRGLSPGLMRPSKSQFRQIAVLAAAAASPANILAAFLAALGNAGLGSKIYVRADVVLLASGQRVSGGQTSAITSGT